MPTPYSYLRCGDLRLPGVMERRNGPLGLRDYDDLTLLVAQQEGHLAYKNLDDGLLVVTI